MKPALETHFATDAFDEAILAIVQSDNQVSHADIGARVGLSASAVRRRLKVLRDQKVIIADVALVDPRRRGLAFIVQVVFEREDVDAVSAFCRQMLTEPAVSQCYATSGECDYWLMVHASTPEDYEAWGQRVLMSNPTIRRYSTSLIWSRTVFRNAAPA
jgi:Lrp/AsnC family transcriptional regulator, leucine-responsive regulatory protein